eukprot:2962824-Amphidinium_carterae.1
MQRLPLHMIRHWAPGHILASSSPGDNNVNHGRVVLLQYPCNTARPDTPKRHAAVFPGGPFDSVGKYP